MSQNRKKRNNKRKKWYFRWNNWQIKIIWRANKIVKKKRRSKRFWPYNDFGDKELKFKYFKIELADMSNEIEEKLFKKIFGHTFETLANKLINTKSKEENQIIVKNVNKSKEKIYEIERSSNFIVQSGDLRANLKYNLDLILDFNETI